MELEESCRIVGIQDLRMWGFHDKTIEFEDHEILIRRITEVIGEVQPEVIYTFYPGYAVHPDHDATGAVVVEAVAGLPKEKRPVVRCMAFSKGCEEVLGPPDVVNDVGGFLNRKVGSINAHRSQFQMGAMLAGKSELDPEIRERFSKERYWTYRFE
jgi:bacillithiol biosynthesis deacetylase BshB2